MSSDGPPRDGPPRARYFAMAVAAAATLLAAIAGLNFVMDPFAVWRHPWSGVNEYHPWMHSEDVYRLAIAVHRPPTLVIGSSRVIIGIDPDSAAGQAWGRPLVVSDEEAHFDFQPSALDAASKGGRLRVALVELDPRQFEPCQQRMPDAGLGGALTRVLLLPALHSSLVALAMNLRADAGERPQAPFQRASGVATPRTERRVESHQSHGLGLFDATPRRRCDYLDDTLGIGRLAQMSALAKARRFQLIFFLAPWRASMLRDAYALGYWPRFERLKRQLAGFAQGSGVPVWDFSTAALRPAGITDADFYDSGHFTPAVGDRLLTIMRRGADDVLGVRLDVSKVETMVAADRQAIASAVAIPAAAPLAAAAKPPARYR